MKQKYSWIIKISLLVIAVVVVGWFALNIFSTAGIPKESSMDAQFGKAKIILNYGNDVSVSVEIIAGGTVLDTTKAAAAGKNIAVETKEYPSMGSLVTRIGDKKNGEGGAYWQFWVNGVYATSSADSTTVHPGDNIEWKFTSSAQ